MIAQSSSGSVNKLTVSSFSDRSIIFQLQSVKNYTFSNIILNKTSGGDRPKRRNLDGDRKPSYAFSIKESYIHSISNLTMISAKISFFYTEATTFNSITGVSIDGVKAGYKFKDCSVALMNNIAITNSGDINSTIGLVANDNSNITIINSSFVNNTGTIGTALSFT